MYLLSQLSHLKPPILTYRGGVLLPFFFYSLPTQPSALRRRRGTRHRRERLRGINVSALAHGDEVLSDQLDPAVRVVRIARVPVLQREAIAMIDKRLERKFRFVIVSFTPFFCFVFIFHFIFIIQNR